LPSADGGHHIVELVVSLGLRSAPPNTTAVVGADERGPSPVVTSDVRLRPPGSDWLYLKLYGPRSGEDELLAGPVRQLSREIDETRVADDWFFVRYADPDAHLRLRFRGAPERLTGTLLPRLCAWASRLVADGRCHKFAFDTYEREVERYGGPEATSATEALFAADSRAAVELLACVSRVDRTLLIVATIDDFLGALGLDAAGRLSWLKQAVTSRKEVGPEYQARREHLIAAVRNPAGLGASVGDVLARRRKAFAQVADRLAKLEADRALTRPLAKLYDDYVHMHCNRLWTDYTAEPRIRGLLLRVRDAIANRPELVSERQAASTTGESDPQLRSPDEAVTGDSTLLEISDPVVGQ